MDNPSFTSNSNSSHMKLNAAASTLLTILILFGVLEAATRLFFSPCFMPTSTFRKLNPAGLSYGFDETEPVFYECGQQTFFVSYESVDSYPTQQSRDDVRIFTLGGSVSVRPRGNNYSILLEKALLQTYGATGSYQVINGAINGYGTTRMLVLLKQILASNQKPDLLIVHPHGSNEFEDEVQLAYLNGLLSEWYNRLLFQSHFFSVLKRVNQRITPPQFAEQTGDAEIEALQDPDRVAQWQQTYDDNLVEMCRLANEANVPIIFVLRVVNPNISPDNTFSDERTYLINRQSYQHTATCQNIYFLDTPQVLDQHYPHPSDETIDKLFFDSFHWRAETHQVIAAQILEIIDENHLLAPPKLGHR